jgi:hypothetical protein
MADVIARLPAAFRAAVEFAYITGWRTHSEVQLGPGALALSWPVWAVFTAAIEYYVLLPVVGPTLKMQVPFWTSLFSIIWIVADAIRHPQEQQIGRMQQRSSHVADSTR